MTDDKKFVYTINGSIQWTLMYNMNLFNDSVSKNKVYNVIDFQCTISTQAGQITSDKKKKID